MKDELVRAMTKDGFVNAVAVTTTGIVERARQIHKTLPTATAALGRLLTAASMMGNMQKVDDGSITLQLKGSGPLGRLLAVSDAEGNVRGWVENPQISMLEKAPGKLDVGAAVGADGTLTVIRDLRMKEPYVGTIDLVSGEIAEDFAMYFTASEQVPSLVSLGVLVGETVEAAGGLIVQMMPGASEAAIASVEQSAGMFMDISGTMREYHLKGSVTQLLVHLEPEILSQLTPAYRCDCSRERVERALISLGREEIEDMIREQHGAQVDCHFCDRRYRLSEEDLRALLNKAMDRRSE